jgi:malonyl-CoA O-methyltransferase
VSDIASDIASIADAKKAAGSDRITCPRKLAIAGAFNRAAAGYDQHAQFQRDVGLRLLRLLPDDLSGLKVLDIGCGTGYFSDRLALRGAQVTAADLSNNMLEQAKQRCGTDVHSYRQADVEALPFSSESYDFVFSSLALQWCADLAIPLRELQRVTKCGGSVYFSTLTDGSLAELKQAWTKIDTHQHVNQFLTEKQIKFALAQSGANNHQLDLCSIRLWYDTSFDLMKDLKGIGATHVNQRAAGLTKRHTLLEVEAEYQKLSNANNQLPATYQVCFGVIDL